MAIKSVAIKFITFMMINRFWTGTHFMMINWKMLMAFIKLYDFMILSFYGHEYVNYRIYKETTTFIRGVPKRNVDMHIISSDAQYFHRTQVRDSLKIAKVQTGKWELEN